MAVQLAEGVLKSRESSSSSTWNNIMVEVSPNVDTETVASNFAAPYNSSSTYNKNDTCIHDNIFYTCKQDGVTGNWNSTKWEVSTAGGVQDKLLSLHDDIGIVIDGKRPSMAVTSGQYVIVRNSTISGITDGLYKANAALSTSTDVTAANLTAVTGGGLNALNDNFSVKTFNVTKADAVTTSGIGYGYITGKTGFIGLDFTTAGGNGWVIIGQSPYKTVNNSQGGIYGMVTTISGSTRIVRIGPGGAITIYSPTANANYMGVLIFPIND